MFFPGNFGNLQNAFSNKKGEPGRLRARRACTNCRKSKKACGEIRPCERCIRLGLADSCVDSELKPEKPTPVATPSDSSESFYSSLSSPSHPGAKRQRHEPVVDMMSSLHVLDSPPLPDIPVPSGLPFGSSTPFSPLEPSTIVAADVGQENPFLMDSAFPDFPKDDNGGDLHRFSISEFFADEDDPLESVESPETTISSNSTVSGGGSSAYQPLRPIPEDRIAHKLPSVSKTPIRTPEVVFEIFSAPQPGPKVVLVNVCFSFWGKDGEQLGETELESTLPAPTEEMQKVIEQHLAHVIDQSLSTSPGGQGVSAAGSSCQTSPLGVPLQVCVSTAHFAEIAEFVGHAPSDSCAFVVDVKSQSLVFSKDQLFEKLGAPKGSLPPISLFVKYISPSVLHATLKATRLAILHPKVVRCSARNVAFVPSKGSFYVIRDSMKILRDSAGVPEYMCGQVTLHTMTL